MSKFDDFRDLHKGPAGIFSGGENGVLSAPDRGGNAVSLPKPEERIVTVTCEDPACGKTFDEFASAGIGWFCPHGASARGNRLREEPIDLDAELSIAEAAAGVGAPPPYFPEPDNPVAHPLPTQSPTVNGWWFGLFALLVLIIVGLVLYAQALLVKISSYELTLSMTNTMSFEQHAAIQRIECTGHEVQHCSGLVLSGAAQNLPARYTCDSTHCAFECGGK